MGSATRRGIENEPSGSVAARLKGILASDVTEQRLRQELAEARDLLIQHDLESTELDHRIANSLQLAASLLRLQGSHSRQDELREQLDMAASRIAAIGRLHKHLYEHRSSGRVDFGRFLRELAPDLGMSTGLVCTVESDSVAMTGEHALNLAIAVNELVMNARKHAYQGQVGGAVSITCRRDGDAGLRLTVTDGGKGLPPDFVPGKSSGVGMSVVASIVRQLDGEIRAENCDGARLTLLIPLRSHAAQLPISRSYSTSDTP